MLLADGEEAEEAVPVKADPEQVEVPAKATVPQRRDVAITVHARLGAESDDGVLLLLIGVLLEAKELLVERRTEVLAVHLGEHLVGRRRVTVHVDVLERDLAVLPGDTLAALDRIEPFVLVVGVDVALEPARELLELGLEVDDRGGERRRRELSNGVPTFFFLLRRTCLFGTCAETSGVPRVEFRRKSTWNVRIRMGSEWVVCTGKRGFCQGFTAKSPLPLSLPLGGMKAILVPLSFRVD